MQDVMLDLETMGNGSNAAIVAVGAIEFDAATNTLGQRFYRVVSLETAVALGGVIDASTVMWWLRQSDEARKDICNDGLPLRQVLAEFSEWLASLGEGVKVWGNGAAFDNVIMAQAYRRAGMPVPWQYQNDRCYRTVKAMRPDVKMERTGTHHNAIADATSQARHLMDILTANAGIERTSKPQKEV
jgi:exodeoxyribonuclease VIII